MLIKRLSGDFRYIQILKCKNANSKLTEHDLCRVFPYAYNIIKAYGPDSGHVP